MKCTKCSHPKNIRKKLSDVDYSQTSGIPGLTLKGVDTYACPKCGNVVHDLGSAEEIADEVTNLLLAQVPLSREGARYIRVHYFEESYFEFGKRVRLSPTFIREIEERRKILNEENGRKIQDAVVRHRATSVSIRFEF